MAGTSPPLIGVTACLRDVGRGPFHSVSEKYLRAVTQGVGGVPVIVPALGAGSDLDALLARLDGVLLTGSPSNVEPHHYDGPASQPGTLHDPHRDATTLPLVRKAVASGLPILALCRGLQEMNVALGGSLHQNVHELPGKRDHRATPDLPREQRYAEAHQVRLTPGGFLAGLAGKTEVAVNSLHAQAIDRLAPGLTIEAVSSEDDVIEAVRLADASGFVLGVQWHPEWSIATNPFSAAIFAAFAGAARDYATRK